MFETLSWLKKVANYIAGGGDDDEDDADDDDDEEADDEDAEVDDGKLNKVCGCRTVQ